MKTICIRTFFILLVLPFSCGFFRAVTNWFYKQCEIDGNFRANLEHRFEWRLFGQHIVQSYVRLAIENHLSGHPPEHALSIIFMGSTGTGKTFVAKIIEESLYVFGREQYVKFYSGRLDFPSARLVHEYRARLQIEIEESVKRCPTSIFIFDEIDKVPPGVIDQIKPYLDYHANINGVDYRRAIFIFLTNWGGNEINSIYLDLRNQGLARESMQNSHFEKSLRHSLYDKSEGMFHESDMIKDFVISHYLPFLPLEKIHVEKCIQNEMYFRGIKKTEEIVRAVTDKMDFHEGLSMSGCKRIADLVGVEAYRHKLEL